LSPGWEPHGRKTSAPDTRELVLQFLPEFLGDETLDGTHWFMLFATSPRARPRIRTDQQRQRVLALAESIGRELRETQRGWLTEVRLSTLLLLSAVSRDWRSSDSVPYQRSVRRTDLARVVPALRLIHGQPQNRVCLADAAEACSLSVPHFSLVFRRAMGVSFAKFALRARLAYAAQLLFTTDLSVENVADRFSFTDGSHFALAFTKHFGVSPGRYRKEHQVLPDLLSKAAGPVD